jgi:hypothetical protein
MAGLQNVFANASSQRDSAGSMMNFYDKLASDQGGLNAQQQQSYAAAKAAYAAASASMAQAAQISQQIQQGKDYMNSPAYKAYLNGTSGTAASTPSAPTPNGGGGQNLYGSVQNGLAEGALNLGRWGWTDTTAKVASGAKNLLGKIF